MSNKPIGESLGVNVSKKEFERATKQSAKKQKKEKRINYEGYIIEENKPSNKQS